MCRYVYVTHALFVYYAWLPTSTHTSRCIPGFLFSLLLSFSTLLYNISTSGSVIFGVQCSFCIWDGIKIDDLSLSFTEIVTHTYTYILVHTRTYTQVLHSITHQLKNGEKQGRERVRKLLYKALDTATGLIPRNPPRELKEK